MKKSRKLINSLAAFTAAAMLAFSGCTEPATDPADAEDTGLAGETAAHELAEQTVQTTVDPVLEGLKEVFDNAEPYTKIFLGVTDNGEYEQVDSDEYYELVYANYLASEEAYEYAVEYEEYDDMSYEEFREEMYSLMGFDPDSLKEFDKYAYFIGLSYYSENEEADHSAAIASGFSHFLRSLSSSGFSPENMDEDKSVYLQMNVTGDVLQISADYDGKDGDRVTVLDNERLCLYGEGYVLLGSTAVPVDTRSLFLSTGDAEYYYYQRKEYYEAVVLDYEDPDIDIAELIEMLPELDRLYVSRHISMTNLESLGKRSSFSELAAYPSRLSEENREILSGLTNIKTLRIGDVMHKEDILWAENAGAEWLAVECACYDELLRSVYTLSKVTELEISTSAEDRVPDLNGIEALKALKKLKITVSDSPYPEKLTDFAPLSGLTALEEFSFSGTNGINFESIGSIKTLKSLTLSGIWGSYDKDDVDLSGLKGCTAVEYLDISEVDSSIWPAVPHMKNLKKIRIGKGIPLYEGLYKALGGTSVEEIIFDDGSYIDMGGISELGNIEKLSFINCDCEIVNFSEIGKCTALKTLVIDCERYAVFDVEDIENNSSIKELYLTNVGFMHYKALSTLSGLERLTLCGTDLTDEQTEQLKKDMPRCVIEVIPPESPDDDDDDNDEDDNDDGEADKPVSYAEPLRTEYFGDVRVETYPCDHDYWSLCLYIKNGGSENIPSLPEFLEENGIISDCDNVYISYPAYAGRSSYVEIFEADEKGLDYEDFDLFLDAFGAYYDEFAERGEYRSIMPGCTVQVLIHIKDE